MVTIAELIRPLADVVATAYVVSLADILNCPAVGVRVTLLPATTLIVLAADPLNVYKFVPSVLPPATLNINELATFDAFTAVPPLANAPTSDAV